MKFLATGEDRMAASHPPAVPAPTHPVAGPGRTAVSRVESVVSAQVSAWWRGV